jgi:hypothetical protein
LLHVPVFVPLALLPRRRSGSIMKKIALLAFLLLANPAAAASTTANGPGALALAAIVASHARALRVVDRNVLARLFGGRSNLGFPANRKITVSADAIRSRRRRRHHPCERVASPVHHRPQRHQAEGWRWRRVQVRHGQLM